MKKNIAILGYQPHRERLILNFLNDGINELFLFSRAPKNVTFPERAYPTRTIIIMALTIC
jgi:hypothetical protein